MARVQPGFTLTLNPREVTDAFEVPLAFLMTPANHQRHSQEWRGIERFYYAMPYGERYIWGATAGILRVLYDDLRMIRPRHRVGIFLIPFVVYAPVCWRRASGSSCLTRGPCDVSPVCLSLRSS